MYSSFFFSIVLVIVEVGVEEVVVVGDEGVTKVIES